MTTLVAGGKELKWLIEDYFPKHIEIICNILKASQSACNGEQTRGADYRATAGGTAGLFPSAATLVLSTVGTDVLKGYVTLDGARICKAEIQILLPSWNKGHPIPLHLAPEHPIELAQISTCSALIDCALKKLVSFGFSTSVPITIREILDDSVRYCKRAVSVLENSDLSFPSATAVFNGAPDDLVVSFVVQNARIVATACIKSFTLGSTSTTGSLPRIASRSSSLLGSHPLSNPPENLVRVDSVVPALTAAHEMLLYCTYSLSLLKDELSKVIL